MPFGECDGVVRPYGSCTALRRHLSSVHDSDLVREHLRRGHFIDRVVKLEGDDLARRKEAVKNQGRHFRPHQKPTPAASLPVMQPTPVPPLSVSATAAYVSAEPTQLLLGSCSKGQGQLIIDPRATPPRITLATSVVVRTGRFYLSQTSAI